MPPRAVRRPATATTLKKKPPVNIPVETDEQEPSSTSKEEKVEKELDVVGHHGFDGSERLELEDKTEAEEDGGGTEVQHEMEGMYDEERFDGDDMVEGEDEEAKDNEDCGDEQGEEINRNEEHRDVVKERRKRKEFEVFVGGLDREATEEDLRKIFSQIGEITEVRLMKNPITQKNKGFAFLRFATVEQAKRAISELDHPVINGKRFGVAPSQDSDTLFVGNICKTWTKETFKDRLAQYGVNNYEELTLVEDTRNEGMNRGFAFLDFYSRSDALDACKHLKKRDVEFGIDRAPKVAFADTFVEMDDDVMAQVTTVFLDGLPATWDEDRVKDHFHKFGKIEKIELARNMPAAKRTDFGFITFDTHDAAEACVEGTNSSELGDGGKKIKVRARLSRPRQRGKSVKHAPGSYLTEYGGGRGGSGNWNPGMPRLDSRSVGRSKQDSRYYSTYSDDSKRSVVRRDRYSDIDMLPDMVGRKRGFSSYDRSLDRRLPGPAYGKSSSKRDYLRYDELISTPSDYITRAPSGRSSSYRDSYTTYEPESSSYRDSYTTYEPEYLDTSRQSSRSAARKPPSYYVEESYERDMQRPSNPPGSHSRDYNTTSVLKRSHPAVDDMHPRYVESTSRQPRARYDYDVGSASSRYDGSTYRSSRSSAGYSYELYDSHASDVGYNRDEVSRSGASRMYSSYGRDYMPTEADVRAGSYSSLYSSRRLNDEYSSGKSSGSYY